MNFKGWLKPGLIIAFAFLVFFLTPDSMSLASKRMTFIFIIAACFWAFEVIPLYATSIVVVLLEIFLLCRPGGVLDMDPSGYKVFLLPFGSPIIMLFFGGFVLAMAMHKYKVDEFCSTRLLKIFGTKPLFLMIGIMLITGFLSMWMSNTATTAMMVGMFMPILAQIDVSDPYRKGLILSIPFAANLGGIGTPIGTPPNAIAIGILEDHGIFVNFFNWMKIAFPLAMTLIVIACFVLYMMYRPKVDRIHFELNDHVQLTRQSKFVIGVVLVTIVLWLTSGMHMIPSSIIALLAASVFIASKLLGKEDLQHLDWDVLILMWGGLALGKGMQISGLTNWIIGLPVFQQEGFVLIVVFAVLGMVLSTFMSNTATSNLLIPIVMVIPGESHIMLAVSVALACSVGMALPVSTPPNAIAFSSGMIHSKDMIKAGALISVISLIAIIILMKLLIGIYGLR